MPRKNGYIFTSKLLYCSKTYRLYYYFWKHTAHCNKIINIIERSQVAGSIQILLMFFYPTPSQTLGDYFLTSLKGLFHTIT